MAPWTRSWCVALIVVALAGLSFEAWLRARDYVPSVQDDADLWSIQYERVRNDAPSIALLGASRIQYAVDVERLQRATGLPTAMLAVNGAYPLAALRALAEDPQFRGVAVVGIDARGLSTMHWDMQQSYVDHFRKRWSLARHVHRVLLSEVQARLVLIRSPFAWVNLLRRRLEGLGLPFNDYVVLRRDRVGFIDYRRSDVDAVRRQRIIDLRAYYADNPAPASDAWLAALEPVNDWIRAIEARGGRVVFFREPESGEHLALDEAHYPRASYWDPFVARTAAVAFDFRDEPAFAGFETPDTSHIDGRDVPRFTDALVTVLRRRQVLPATP